MCEDDKAGSESAVSVSQLVLQTKVREDFTITEKAPTKLAQSLLVDLRFIQWFMTMCGTNFAFIASHENAEDHLSSAYCEQ